MKQTGTLKTILLSGLLVSGLTLMSSRTFAQVQPLRTIAVIGHASAAAVDGERVVRISVTVKEATAALAYARLADQLRTVKQDLEAAGVQRKEMDNGEVAMHPSYDYSKAGLPPTISGYQLVQQLTVHVDNEQQLPSVIDAATSAGASSVSIGIESKEGDADNASLQLAALKDAHARADELAKAAGLVLGDVLSVAQVQEDAGAGPMSEREREEMEHEGGGGSAKPVTLELRVVYSVK